MEKIKFILLKVWGAIKNAPAKSWPVIKEFFLSLPYRMKPRWRIRWIVTAIIWLIVLVYVGFGIYGGIKIYAKQDEGSAARFAAKIYPFPAAYAGGNIIWAKEYYKQISYIRHFNAQTKQDLSDAELKKLIMDKLINDQIYEWEAAKGGLRISSKDVQDAYNTIVEESGGEASVKKVLNELYGMNEKDFKQLVRQKVVQEKIQTDLIAQIKVLHILVKDEARANEVANKAKSGEAWDQLAKTYSEDVKTRDNWGNLGWISRGDLLIDNKPVPEFEDAAFKAKVNEVFGPVKSQVGFQIGKVEEKKGKIQESFAQWSENAVKETKVINFFN